MSVVGFVGGHFCRSLADAGPVKLEAGQFSSHGIPSAKGSWPIIEFV
jgi:hypothetical protein